MSAIESRTGTVRHGDGPFSGDCALRTAVLSLALYCALGMADARADVIVLGDAELDIITAAGLDIVADASGGALANGTSTVSDSYTNSSVGPDEGSASVLAVSAGPDGGAADGLAIVIGAGSSAVYSVEGGAQGMSEAATPVIVSASAGLSSGEGGTSVQAAAAGSADQSASSAIAIVDATTAEGTVGVIVMSDGFSTAGADSGASVGAATGTTGAGSTLTVTGASEGDTFAASASATETTVAIAGGTVGIQSATDAVALGEGSEVEISTTQRINGSSRVTVLRVRSTADATGETVLMPVAETTIDSSGVPTDARVREITRSFSRIVPNGADGERGIARSFTILIVAPPRPEPMMPALRTMRPELSGRLGLLRQR